MHDNEIENLELEKLCKALLRLEKPVLKDEKKRLLKNSVLTQIKVPVIHYIRSLVSEVKVDFSKKISIKDRIFELIDQTSQKKWFWSNFFMFQKKFVTALVLICISFSMFLSLKVGTDTNVVMAETFTTLDSFSGEVFLERDGNFIDIYEGMTVYEKDRLITGTDGIASVKFFDDSISRLSADTEIIVNKLFKPQDSLVQSYVEISVTDGNVWSRVINLVEEKSSFVVQAMDVYASAKKAAFNVEVSGEEIKINVFRNVVDVKTSGGVEQVVSGQKAVLSENKEVEVSKIDENEKGSEWVQGNLDSDKEYLTEVEERLLAAKIENIETKAGDEFKSGNSVKEEAMLFLTFDDVKKKKMELDLAEKDFIAAEVKLNDKNLTDEDLKAIDQTFATFSNTVNAFSEFVDNVSYTDSEYADELNLYLEEKILLQKKNFSLVLPDSPSYKAKEVINQLELLTVEDEQEAIKLKSVQEFSKLSEAEEVLDNGDLELATKIVDDYKSGVEGVMQTIDSLDAQDEKEGILKDELTNDVKKGQSLVDGIEIAVSEEEIMQQQEIIDIQEVKVDSQDIDENVEVKVEEWDKPLSPLLTPLSEPLKEDIY